MIKSSTLVILLSILALQCAGCAHSPRPQAKPFPSAKIQRIDSAQHWDVMAKQLSIDLSAKYRLMQPNIQRGLFVDETDNSVFSKSLKSLLITHLVAKGIPILTTIDRSAENCNSANLSCTPLRLKMDIQIVKHNEIAPPIPYKGISLLKDASYVLYLVGDYWTSPIWAVLPLSEYIKNYYPAETNTEILVNASLLDGDYIVSSDSSIYYVNDIDSAIYESNGYQLDGSTQALAAPSPYNMKRSAIATAALDGKCGDIGNNPDSSTKLIQQGSRMETYEVHCRNSHVTVRCEEYDQCHVVF